MSDICFLCQKKIEKDTGTTVKVAESRTISFHRDCASIIKKMFQMDVHTF